MDMKYVYPDPLKQAIHMHWLVDPTGSKDGFRGVDWVMNLYTNAGNSKLRNVASSLPLFSGNIWWQRFQPALSVGRQKPTIDRDVSKGTHQYSR